jgi:hypothetical protein
MQTAAKAAIASRDCEHEMSLGADGEVLEAEYLLTLPDVQRLVQLEEWLANQNLFYVSLGRDGAWHVDPASCPR